MVHKTELRRSGGGDIHTGLRVALQQPRQNPVALIDFGKHCCCCRCSKMRVAHTGDFVGLNNPGICMRAPVPLQENSRVDLLHW